MRVLVTGGAGFIGSHIVDRLVEEGLRPSVVDNLSTGREGHVPSDIPFYRESVNSERLEQVFAAERPEFVIHQAAQVNVRRSTVDPRGDATINILGAVNVLEQCRKHGVKKVVYASSAAVYGDPQYLPVDEAHPLQPTSPYGVSKHTVEHYLEVFRRLYDIDYTVLRYANVYGPRQDALGEGGVVAIFTHRAVLGQEVTVYGDGEQTRDYVYVGDVAEANFLALTRAGGEILNVGCQEETTVNDLFQLVKTAAGTEPKLLYGPARPGDITRSVLANKRARSRLDWTPKVDLAEGLSRVVEYEKVLLS